MKRLTALVAASILILCLAACNDKTQSNEPSSEDRSHSSTFSVQQSQSSSNTTSTSELPSPVTGAYQGKKVTLSYRAITDIEYDESMMSSYFINGYAVCYDLRQTAQSDYKSSWSCIDHDGKIVLQATYDSISCFDRSGIAVVQSSANNDLSGQNKYHFINTKGEIIGTADKEIFDQYNDMSEHLRNKSTQNSGGTRFALVKSTGAATNCLTDAKGNIIAQFPDEYNIVYFNSDNMVLAGSDIPRYLYAYDSEGNKLNDAKFQAVGNVEGGLCPFIQDNKLGIMGETGEMVIPATFETEYNLTQKIYLSEGHIIIYQNGRIAVLQVTVK